MTLVTEQEAAEKWCPLSRVEDPNAARPIAVNRTTVGDYDRSGMTVGHIPGHARCIGSECMAWRKGPDRIDEGWRDLQNRPVSIEVGYCGAFGKVEP